MRYPNKKRRSVAGPCQQLVSSDGHLRKVKTTRIRQPLVQWQVKAGFVIANLNIMER
jgi:hypothetical protein